MTAADAKALCDAISHPRVGVTIDTFHANIEEKNIANATRSLRHCLRHVHASENDRGLLGSGHVDFPAIVTALREIAYDGYLMIEGFGYSPEEVDSLGALWGDLKVSPEDIAFGGGNYLRTFAPVSCFRRGPEGQFCEYVPNRLSPGGSAKARRVFREDKFSSRIRIGR